MNINRNDKYALDQREEHVERFDSRFSFVPYVEIIEQPASRGQRFRYECEGRFAGSIPGATSTFERRTYPTIRIVGYQGPAIILVSCVTKDFPYKPHPHHIVGREGCSRGVFSVRMPSTHAPITFPNLGIQCVKKKDIQEALKLRKQLRIDPFSTGFDHMNHPSKIDLNAVRLCFQVYIEGSQGDKFNVPLRPVVTEPVYDKKAVADLTIYKLSHERAPASGGLEMILLCEKIVKEDIRVRFFEEIDDNVVWEQYGEFQQADVHKQYAITFRTPKYCRQDIQRPVQVYVQLRRPSDDAYSEPLPFKMDPLPKQTASEDPVSRKRKEIDDDRIAAVTRNVLQKIDTPAETSKRPVRSNFDLAKTGQPEQNYFPDGDLAINDCRGDKRESPAQTQQREQLRFETTPEEGRCNGTFQMNASKVNKAENGVARGDARGDERNEPENDRSGGETSDVPMETTAEMRDQSSTRNRTLERMRSEVAVPTTSTMFTRTPLQMLKRMQTRLEPTMSSLAAQTELQAQPQPQPQPPTQLRGLDRYLAQQQPGPGPSRDRESRLEAAATIDAIDEDGPVGLQQVTQPEAARQSSNDAEYGPLNSSLNQLDSEELAVFGTMLSEKLWNGLSISDADLDGLELENGSDAGGSGSAPFPEPMNLQSVYKSALRNGSDLMIT